MPQSKLSPERLERLRPTLKFDNPVIVRVAHETWHAVRGHLVLKIDFGYRRAEVVRVEIFFCGEMAELDAHAIRNVLQRVEGLPVFERVTVLGTVEDAPVVIFVGMGVECNLLLWKEC